MKTFYALPILGAVAVSTSLCLSGIAAATDLETSMSNPSNWASQAGDYSNHRYSTLDQINTKNVSNLQVAWTMSTGVLRGHEGSPLVVGNTMYLHTPFPNNVYAINLADQTYKWKYEPKQDATVVPVMCCDTVNRGLAFGDGKIFLQQADTTLVALDGTTGKDASLKTWKGDQWKIGGGTTWGWYSYDPKLNLVYYGLGNPSTWNPNQRPGDNKWSMTTMARDLNTGVAKWVYQMTPHDEL